MSVKIIIDGHPKQEVNVKHGLTFVICKTIQTCWWFYLYKVRAVYSVTHTVTNTVTNTATIP